MSFKRLLEELVSIYNQPNSTAEQKERAHRISNQLLEHVYTSSRGHLDFVSAIWAIFNEEQIKAVFWGFKQCNCCEHHAFLLSADDFDDSHVECACSCHPAMATVWSAFNE